MGFQTQVNQTPAPAVAGDFASANPRKSLNSGPGGLVASAAGVLVGQFAWDDGTGVVYNAKPGAGSPRLGFACRMGQVALITAWLGGETMLVPEGMPITLHTDVDTYGVFAAGATPGQQVFAKHTDGSLLSAAAGSAPAGYDQTAWIVCPGASGVAGELAKISTGG